LKRFNPKRKEPVPSYYFLSLFSDAVTGGFNDQERITALQKDGLTGNVTN
jgi:hypothetical protein